VGAYTSCVFNVYVLEYGLAVSLQLKYRSVFSVPCTEFFTILLEYPAENVLKTNGNF
jgi:hypothetical protein